MLRFRDNRLVVLFTLASAPPCVSWSRTPTPTGAAPPPFLGELAHAITDRCLITFRYEGRPRRVHPDEVHATTSGWVLTGRDSTTLSAAEYVTSWMADLDVEHPGTAEPLPPEPTERPDPMSWELDPPMTVLLAARLDFVPDVLHLMPGAEVVPGDGVETVIKLRVTNRAAFRARLTTSACGPGWSVRPSSSPRSWRTFAPWQGRAMALYARRIAGLPRLLDVLFYHPMGMRFADLAQEVGRSERDVQETLRAYHLTDLARYIPDQVARPEVLEFFSGDPEDDGDPLGAIDLRGAGAHVARHILQAYEDVPPETAGGQSSAEPLGRRSHPCSSSLGRPTLTSPDNADRLVRRCGWSLSPYERWLADGLVAGLRASRSDLCAEPRNVTASRV